MTTGTHKKKVTTHEAKTHFSRLLRRVQLGEEIVIQRGQEAVAKLVPWREGAMERVPGEFAGQIWVADDFDALPEDVLTSFEGGRD